MRTYRVVWEIDIEAESAEGAARRALEIHRDPTSVATVFTVAPMDALIAPEEIDIGALDALDWMRRGGQGDLDLGIVVRQQPARDAPP